MDKILISLTVPVLQEHYDLFVPTDMVISGLTDLIARGISDMTGGKFSPSGFELLTSKKPEMLLNPNYTLQDYHIPDGAELMLL